MTHKVVYNINISRWEVDRLKLYFYTLEQRILCLSTSQRDINVTYLDI